MVAVWLSANVRKIKVNALLDDSRSVSYVNKELAGALGLSAAKRSGCQCSEQDCGNLRFFACEHESAEL